MYDMGLHTTYGSQSEMLATVKFSNLVKFSDTGIKVVYSMLISITCIIFMFINKIKLYSKYYDLADKDFLLCHQLKMGNVVSWMRLQKPRFCVRVCMV
jgi:hypothetical protein